MEAGDFKKWRKTLGLSQKDAAHLLGLKRRMIQSVSYTHLTLPTKA